MKKARRKESKKARKQASKEVRKQESKGRKTERKQRTKRAKIERRRKRKRQRQRQRRRKKHKEKEKERGKKREREKEQEQGEKERNKEKENEIRVTPLFVLSYIVPGLDSSSIKNQNRRSQTSIPRFCLFAGFLLLVRWTRPPWFFLVSGSAVSLGPGSRLGPGESARGVRLLVEGGLRRAGPGAAAVPRLPRPEPRRRGDAARRWEVSGRGVRCGVG